MKTILNKKEGAIFTFYALILLYWWFSSLAIIYHVITKELLINEVGPKELWDKVFTGLIALILIIKYPFLRPTFWHKEEKLKVKILRILSIVCISIAFISFAPLLFQLILVEINIVLMFYEFILLFCCLAITILIEKIFIPLARSR